MNARRSCGFGLLLALSLSGCSSDGNASAPSGPPATAGAAGASAGSAGASQAGASGAGVGGASNTAGAAGSIAGTSNAGSSGAAGAAGGASAGASGGAVITDPGSEGDGSFTIGPSYTADPLNKYANAPVGKQFSFEMASKDSPIYPGRNGAYSRTVWVYVPAGYVPGSAAPLIVVQDGYFAVWFGNDVPHTQNPAQTNLPGTANLPRILDNMIAAGKLPKMVAVFVTSGGGDGGNSQRGLEYDTVSGKYAEFVDSEVLPRAVSEAQKQLQLDLKFTKDPEGRATLGGSSGGAASFSMAWWHPELFRRVISYSGTFVRQASPEDPLYPHGCWAYHDYDPYDASKTNGVIVKEPTTKPIRVWIEAGQNDLQANSGPGSYRDFRLANQRMAMSFKAKGYHYHHDDALGAGHLDGNAVAQTLPSALLWVWRGYPIQ